MNTLSSKVAAFLESVKQNILAENLGELEKRKGSVIFDEFLVMIMVWSYRQVQQEDFTQVKTLALSRINVDTFQVFWTGLS